MKNLSTLSQENLAGGKAGGSSEVTGTLSPQQALNLQTSEPNAFLVTDQPGETIIYNLRDLVAGAVHVPVPYDPDALTPEGIAYGVGRVYNRKPVTAEDIAILREVAASYGFGIVAFVQAHVRNQKDFNSLLDGACYSGAGVRGSDDTALSLMEAIALIQEYHFLGTAANITALYRALRDANTPEMRIQAWKKNMKITHDFDFRALDYAYVRPKRPYKKKK